MMILKPCPFCGSDKISKQASRGRYGWFGWIECDVCGARTNNKKLIDQDSNDPSFFGQDTFELLADLWNMRWKGCRTE